MAHQYLDLPDPSRFETWPHADWIVGADWAGNAGETSDVYEITRAYWDLSRYMICVTSGTLDGANALDYRAVKPAEPLMSDGPWRLFGLVKVEEGSGGATGAGVTLQIRTVSGAGSVSNTWAGQLIGGGWILYEYELDGADEAVIALGGDLLPRVWVAPSGGVGTITVHCAGVWVQAGDGPMRIQGIEAVSAANIQVLRPPLLTVTPSVTAPDDVVKTKALYPPLLAVEPTLHAPIVLAPPGTLVDALVDDIQVWQSAQGAEKEARVAMRELNDGDDQGDLIDYFKLSTGTGTDVYGEEGGEGELINTARWAGFDGGAEIAGRRKPRLYGTRHQVAGVQVDAQRLVWQVHDGPVSSIKPRDGGHDSLTNAGDRSNIYDSPPAAGQYTTQLSEGLVRLYEEPTSTLAFEVDGDAPTDNGETGFSANPGVIARRLIQHVGGLSLGQIMLSELDVLATISQGPVGFTTGESPITLRDMLNVVFKTIDGWWLFTGGKFSCGLKVDGAAKLGLLITSGKRPSYGGTSTPDFYLTDDDLSSQGPTRRKTREVARAWTLRHSQYEVQVGLADVLGAVPEGDRWQYGQEWRTAEEQVPRTDDYDREFPEALDMTADVGMSSSLAAQLEAYRRLSTDRYPRDVFSFPLQHVDFRFPVRMGGVFHYTGLEAEDGAWFLVVGVSQDPATRRLTIDGWRAAQTYEEQAKEEAGLAAYIPETTVITGAAGRGDV